MERLIIEKIRAAADQGDAEQIGLANELFVSFKELTNKGLTDFTPEQGSDLLTEYAVNQAILAASSEDTPLGHGNTRAFTVSQAAEFLGCGVDNIKYHIKSGNLPRRIFGKNLVLIESDLVYLSSRKNQRRSNT